MKNFNTQRLTRAKKVRSRLVVSKIMSRLSVFRSNKFIYAQVIDDANSKTLVAASDKKAQTKKSKLENAKNVGEQIAKMALAKKIKKVVFDRGGYKYHGRIKALAQGAREGGLEF